METPPIIESPPSSIQEWLTEDEAAAELRVDRRTIRKMIDKKRLAATDCGSDGRHCYRIHRDDLRQTKPQTDGPGDTVKPEVTCRRPRFRQTSVPRYASFFPTASKAVV